MLENKKHQVPFSRNPQALVFVPMKGNVANTWIFIINANEITNFGLLFIYS